MGVSYNHPSFVQLTGKSKGNWLTDALDVVSTVVSSPLGGLLLGGAVSGGPIGGLLGSAVSGVMKLFKN